MTTDQSFSRPHFGGHEKFVFRQGWLKKAVDFALEDPAIFNQEDAFVRLGVGKNMATSIRYWGLATGFLEEPSRRRDYIQPTRLGKALLVDGGWDPYLEDIGTLWLIHWQLVSNREQGLVWYLIFSRYFDVEFRKEQLIDFIERQLIHIGLRTTSAMIEREIDVFLRTYTSTQVRQGLSPEESLDCPLVELGLIQQNERVYRFDVGRKPTLPLEIFGFALITYLCRHFQTRNTATVDECIYHPGSPGQLFKLDDHSVMDYLEKLETATKVNLRLREAAGQWQIYWQELSIDNGWELLRNYYE